MKVALRDYNARSSRIASALAAAGHEVGEDGPADLFLIDLDPPEFGYRELIDRHRAAGARIVMYPHITTAPLVYDGLFEPYEHIDASLVVGLGQAEFLRRIEYPHEVHVIGFSLCDLEPFRPRPDVNRVLFAPLHPSPHGDLADQFRECNTGVFKRLIAGPWDLTVRHIGTIEQNGLWPVDGVEFVQGTVDRSYADMDAADVVVAGQGTYPTLSIARGIPTVVAGAMLPPMYGFKHEPVHPLRRPERYRDYIRFPLDGDADPLDEIIRAAGRSEQPIAEWKRRFIGKPLDEAAVVTLLERVASGPAGAPRLDVDGRVVLGFAEEVAGRPELLQRLRGGTLVLWAPGVAQHEAEAMIAGHDGPIVALGHPASAASDRALAERADALLSDWPSAGRIGALPRC